MHTLTFEDTEFIRKWEGHSLKAYRCPAGVLTISYGITGEWIKPDTVITEEKSNELFMLKLKEYSEPLNDMLKREPTKNQYIALLSLCYNIGVNGFKKSSVLKEFNEGNDSKTVTAFMKHIRCNGKMLNGLVNRRLAEVKLYNTKA